MSCNSGACSIHQVVLVFPGENSLTLEEYMHKHCHQTTDGAALVTADSEEEQTSSVTDGADKEPGLAQGQSSTDTMLAAVMTRCRELT